MDCSLPESSVHGIFQERILERITIPFSRGSSHPRDWTQVSHIAGEFFTVWVTREAPKYWSGYPILSPGDLPNPGIKPGSPALQVDSLPAELPGERDYLWLTLKFSKAFDNGFYWTVINLIQKPLVECFLSTLSYLGVKNRSLQTKRQNEQWLWRTVWMFLKKLKIELPYDPAIPLLGIYLDKTLI